MKATYRVLRRACAKNLPCFIATPEQTCAQPESGFFAQSTGNPIDFMTFMAFPVPKPPVDRAAQAENHYLARLA
ncbi:hypothetical protein HED49_02980 [Ochrobactrum daejeonense]|nr:hypothetical protein [Brucella daejeonensis]